MYSCKWVQIQTKNNYFEVQTKVKIEIKAKFNYIHWNSIYIYTSPKLWQHKEQTTQQYGHRIRL